MDLSDLKARLEREGFNPNLYCIEDDCPSREGRYSIRHEGLAAWRITYVERGEEHTVGIYDLDGGCRRLVQLLDEVRDSRHHLIATFSSRSKADALDRALEGVGIRCFRSEFKVMRPRDMRHEVWVHALDLVRAKELRRGFGPDEP